MPAKKAMPSEATNDDDASFDAMMNSLTDPEIDPEIDDLSHLPEKTRAEILAGRSALAAKAR